MTDEAERRRLTGTVLALEETLWRSATRFDRDWMVRVLHPDFHEFGRSGRRWTRSEIVRMAAVDIAVAWPPEHVSLALVAPGVALLTYVTVDDDGHASDRSSLWLHEPSGEPAWRLRFHQGTPTTA